MVTSPLSEACKCAYLIEEGWDIRNHLERSNVFLPRCERHMRWSGVGCSHAMDTNRMHRAAPLSPSSHSYCLSAGRRMLSWYSSAGVSFDNLTSSNKCILSWSQFWGKRTTRKRKIQPFSASIFCGCAHCLNLIIPLSRHVIMLPSLVLAGTCLNCAAVMQKYMSANLWKGGPIPSAPHVSSEDGIGTAAERNIVRLLSVQCLLMLLRFYLHDELIESLGYDIEYSKNQWLFVLWNSRVCKWSYES